MLSIRFHWAICLFAFIALGGIVSLNALPSDGIGQAGPAAFDNISKGRAGEERPNVVIILADDAALMDFGTYGGEASTPNIDELANKGAVFTQYRTSPLCAPSRAMLLTGMDNHLTGVATIPEVIPDEQVGKPGYTMALEPGVLTVADRLKAAGYHTLMAGKWHLGEEVDQLPQAHGFDRSFALAASGADNWEDRSFLPFYKDAPWYEDGKEAGLPEDFYSSKFIVDKTIEYVAENEGTKPFIAYLPFQAIHIPVQAPQEFIDNYKGRYDAGWETLREERHQRARDIGLIPQAASIADVPPNYRRWDDLSADDQKLYAARMEVNAAMIEAMDFHIGRLMDYLKQQDQFDNTIFIVTSDNGAEPSRGDDNFSVKAWHFVSGYDISLETMGGPDHWGFIGPEWAAAAATPGAWFKFYTTEGGIRAPLIVSGPGVEPSRINSPAMVTDVAPTVLDWVGVDTSPSNAKPMTGRSLYPVLKGEAESAYGPNDVRAVEVSGNAALYKGDYKITRSLSPMGDGKWRLFNIATDPGETTDLAAQEPAIFQDLQSEYDDYANRVGVLEMPDGYNAAAQISANSQTRLLQNYPWLYAVVAVIFVIFAIIIWLVLRWVWRRRKQAA